MYGVPFTLWKDLQESNPHGRIATIFLSWGCDNPKEKSGLATHVTIQKGYVYEISRLENPYYI